MKPTILLITFLLSCSQTKEYSATPYVSKVLVQDSLYQIRFETPNSVYLLKYKSKRTWEKGDSLEFRKIESNE